MVSSSETEKSVTMSHNLNIGVEFESLQIGYDFSHEIVETTRTTMQKSET